MSTPQATTLNAIDFPLWGSRLIEASAGTGKTWTIAALYLRLVLGHGAEHGFARALRPAEILVMTFTRAATRELSDRIRARLIEAARCFRGEAPVPDGDRFLAQLLASYPEGAARTQAAWRLALAAEGMDDAAVHTIDAWCQRMLREHAFDSGILFDEELSADERTVQIEAAQDYWRQQCYPLAGEALDTVLAVWRGVDALVADMRGLVAQDLPEGAGAGTLADCVLRERQARRTAIAALKADWAGRAGEMQQWLDDQTAPKQCDWDKRKLAQRHYTGWVTALAEWAQGTGDDLLALSDTAWHRLSPDGLREARKDGAPPIALPMHFEALAALQAAQEALPDPAVALRLHAAACVQQRIAQLKRQTGTFGFADMLQRLDQALAGPNGERLRERMVAQTPVALIDEFQDTSPLQYRIFDRLYRTADNAAHTALLLIGDPKQSIYGFRGADIHSYLAARRATAGRHYMLGTNHRSTTALVAAVNHWFGRAEARAGAGAFLFRDAAGQDNPLPFVPVQARGRAEQFQTATGPVPALAIHHDLELHSAGAHRQRFAARCAEQIVGWLNDAQAGFAQPGKPFQRLRPADIAVLVRTGTEAEAIRRELHRRGVASVYLSDKDSVFVSDEARDLLYWLHAVADPLDARKVRAGLATRTLGLSLDELAWLAASDEAFDARSLQLRQLHGVWQTQGVLTLLRQTLHQFGLPARWLGEPGGERRLTNFLHLAELLQAASAGLDGEHALIRWLQTQVQEGGSSGDEQIVRLESDADLVKVVTVHKSKGLEYPVVCLPFACSFREVTRHSTGFVQLAGADGQRTLHLQLSDDTVAQAEHERLREDLRLLYVALTRARHALWLGFAALRVGHSLQCRTHQSAAGCLLGGGAALGADDWRAPLQALADGVPQIALYAALDEVPRTRLASREPPAPLHAQPPYAAAFERRWGIGSFSQLVRGTAQAGAPLAPLQGLRPADDEAGAASAQPLGAAVVAPEVRAVPAVAVGQTGDLFAVPAEALPAVWHRFARGALAGNFLHDQLEWLAGEGFALSGNPALAERLRRRCERAGHAAHADEAVQWLTAVVQASLPGVGVPLHALRQVLPEMEFWLPAQRLRAAEVDALCHAHLLPGQERPPLPERELRGMLMGFADLVFEHGGRYWVLDYKSNHLGDEGSAYTQEALGAAMAAHRYDVQAALYLLALHRLLRARLGTAYVPGQHLGGALYFFLRGIDGPAQGVHLVAPPLALLDALDALLDREEEGA
ncbi:MAG: exodeoxyribonuclease V subunit beta [Verminephrobacter sp.]|nr:exodeoxyribonuclease V subunit beta [Verminephrobacter sp.]